MKIKSVNLETVCGVTSVLPENEHPEVAFAGKSNVGKSSLINALMNRKSYARMSSQPGKTQTINFYNINDEIYFVDLPGYGYANANVKVKAAWGKMIEKYLQKSPALIAVFLLIDIRHAPGQNDRDMYDWIVKNGYEPIIIATKSDKIKRSQLQKQLKLIRDTLGCRDALIIPFSSETKDGREEVYNLLDDMLDYCRKQDEAAADGEE
ncbi:MAG: YihA family ribosome biogenesis GTP-binding protein [Lachnospiraceae bacterium]|nr:YihA family ribosome biogenesis GTP-binding protein [Candidatus Colinaster scatohippi]